MRTTNRKNGFILCLLLNLILNLEWTVPAIILLVLHFVWIKISIWWFVGAVAIWFIFILLKTVMLSVANRCGKLTDQKQQNKNPYSQKDMYK